MSAPLPPWLSISPFDYLKAAEAGTQAGIERGRLALSIQQEQARQQEAAAQLAQKDEKNNAAMALRRDALQLNSQAARERVAAGNALRLAQMKQAGLLGQEKLGQGQERIDQSGQSAADKNANTAAFQQGTLQNNQDRNQTAADALAAKTDANVPKMSFADQENLKDLYGQKAAAQVAFDNIDDLKDHDAKLKALGKLVAIKNQIKLLTQPTPAASTLTQGTGTNLPAAPDAPAPSPIFPANPAASSLSPRGNYSAPLFPAPGTAQGKVAMGGYKIGRKYNGMTYLGGDPNDANNWQQ